MANNNELWNNLRNLRGLMGDAEYASALTDWVAEYRDSMPQREQHLFSTNLKHIMLNDSIIQLSNHTVTRRRRLPSWGAIYMSFLFGPMAEAAKLAAQAEDAYLTACVNATRAAFEEEAARVAAAKDADRVAAAAEAGRIASEAPGYQTPDYQAAVLQVPDAMVPDVEGGPPAIDISKPNGNLPGLLSQQAEEEEGDDEMQDLVDEFENWITLGLVPPRVLPLIRKKMSWLLRQLLRATLACRSSPSCMGMNVLLEVTQVRHPGQHFPGNLHVDQNIDMGMD
ncbi:hypothetical protein CC79DRAFT_1367775 [Sarocladium strictum]